MKAHGTACMLCYVLHRDTRINVGSAQNFLGNFYIQRSYTIIRSREQGLSTGQDTITPKEALFILFDAASTPPSLQTPHHDEVT